MANLLTSHSTRHPALSLPVKLLTLCSGTVLLLAASGGSGPGGGGGSADLTISSGGTILVAQVGRPANSFTVTATFKNEAPAITLTSAPAGLFIENTLTSRQRGGPFITIATVNAWTPTRDEIGPHTVTFTATAGGLSQSAVMTITVQDAPDPVTALTAVSQGGFIQASWQPSAVGGTAPISYRVEGCYDTGPRAFHNICEQTAMTTGTEVSFPANHTGTFPGPYILVIVTPIDADGVEGGRVVIAPTLAAQ